MKSGCFCMFSEEQPSVMNPGHAPVYLNVYDLTPANDYFYWAGIGIFHTGIEVYGVEYAFGAHDYPSSGVFEVEPRQCPGFKFRKSIFMGTTILDPNQIREFMERHSVNYNGNTYHLIVKNCNHFCKDVCYKLTKRKIPRWVNRLAGIGSVCNCILPEALQINAIPNDRDGKDPEGEKTRLRGSAFSFMSSISLRQYTSPPFISSSWDLSWSSDSSLKERSCKDSKQCNTQISLLHSLQK